MANKEKLAVIDGHALIHRAYHAIPALSTKDGEPVNAVYGFTLILLNVLKELKPKYVVVAYDLPGKTKRHEEYKEYKANRKEKPDDLGPQIERTRDIVAAFNIPLITKQGYEADDVIGTIVKKAPPEIESYIVTGDMDELQLVDDHTKVYTMRRGFSDTVVYDEEKVIERYGLRPDQLVDYRALKGDPSDNIPGVSGVGEKTATDLIKTYGELDKVYDNLENIKPTITKKLKADKDQAYLSKKLSNIETDLDLNLNLKDCCLADYDRNKVLELFQQLGFKSLFEKIPESNQAHKTSARKHLKDAKYELVTDKAKLNKVVGQIQKAKIFSIDTETTSQNKMKAELVGISISPEEGRAYYLPIGHEKGPQLELKDVQEVLGDLIADPKVKKTGHNLKYDYQVLKRAGLPLSGISFDTMIAAYLLDPNMRSQKLSTLALQELGIEMVEIEELIGSGKDQLTFNKTTINDAMTYACEDADVALRLTNLYHKKLEKNDLLSLAQKIEFPLIEILAEMELAGIGLDAKRLEALSQETAKKIQRLEKSITKKAGKDININSPAQLQKVLFEKLKLQEKIDDPRDLKKLKNGGYSTAASELEKLRGVDPIIEDIFSYRELAKLKNTYIDVLPQLTDTKGRIHTNFNQTITQTGRLSSTEPNLQNIPIRTETGRKIREAFVANPGNVFVSADYSQIELRVVAHLADDDVMKKVFRAERDIHSETAAKLYDVTEKDVTKEMRRAAKIVNFGILYGVSAHGLRQQVGVTREEGQRLIDRYFEIHPKIKEYSEKMIERAKDVGYVETLFGRKRYLPEINSRNFNIRMGAERMAVNMPVQGTAADLMKLAMIDIEPTLKEKHPKAKILLQIHDELLVECPEKEAHEVSELLKTRMNHVVELSVPIKTDVHQAKTWGGAK